MLAALLVSKNHQLRKHDRDPEAFCYALSLIACFSSFIFLCFYASVGSGLKLWGRICYHTKQKEGI